MNVGDAQLVGEFERNVLIVDEGNASEFSNRDGNRTNALKATAAAFASAEPPKQPFTSGCRRGFSR